MAAAWLASGGKLRFGVKPPTPTLNLAHPLAEGLVFDANYFAPGLGGNIERAGLTPRSAYTGTTTSIGPHGVARTFPGGAATDADTYVANAAVNGLTDITVELLFKKNGAGGGGLGRLIRKGGANGRWNAFLDDTNSWMRLQILWSGNDGDWTTPAGSVPTGAWFHAVIAYSFSSTANDPTIWLNGVTQTLTENFTPAGTAPADTTSLIIGNREDGARAVSADISHTRIWNRMLSQGEVAQLYADPFAIYVGPKRPVLGLAPGTGITGTVAVTDGADTSAATGAVRISGSSATADAADTGTATGAVRVSGTVAANDADDTSAATGTVGASPITGSVAVTDGADTSAATATARVSGSVATNDNDDTTSATGDVRISGSVSVTDGADVSDAHQTAVPISGTVAANDDNDVSEATGFATLAGGTYPEAIEGGGSVVLGNLSGGGSVVAGSLSSSGRVIADYLRGRP